MIKGYRFSRKEIVDMIKKCEKTKKGIYWTPNISPYLSAEGLTEDKRYYYKREAFSNKVYFTEEDIKYFLATKELDNYIFNLMRKIDQNFIENNYDTFNLRLKNKVVPYDFTVAELLNSFIGIKYAIFCINI